MATNLTVKLGMDGKGFNQGLSKADKGVKGLKSKIGGAMSGIGAKMGAMLGAAVIGQQIKQTVEWGKNINTLSVQFGLTKKEVMGLEHAMSATGMSVNQSMSAFKTMQIFAHRVTSEFRGSMRRKELAWSFEQVGISIEEIENLKPYELFRQIARNMKGANLASSELTEAIGTIFGGDGKAMMEAFNGDIDGMIANFERMGPVSDEVIENLAGIAESWDMMGPKINQAKAHAVGFFSKVGMGLFHIGDVGSQAFGEWWRGDLNEKITGLISPFSKISDVNEKIGKEMGEQLWQQKRQEEAAKIEEERLTRINALAERRKSIAEKIAGIQKTQEERRFAELTDAQKKIELEKQLAEEMEKRKKLGKMDDLKAQEAPKWFQDLTGEFFFDAEGNREAVQSGGHDVDAPLDKKESGDFLGIFGDAFKDFGRDYFRGTKDVQMEGREARNLARMEADEKIKKKQEEISKLKIVKEKVVKGEGGIGSTFSSLTSIGGRLSAKSPFLTNAEKTLTLQEEQRKLLASIDKTMHIFGP